MVKRFFALLCLGVLLLQASGYAWSTRKNFEKVLASWLGRDSDELVPNWGAPNSVYGLSSGGKVLTYITNTGTGGSLVPLGGTGTYMTVNRQWYCKVSFTIDPDNRIVRWSYQGNNCRSKAPKNKSVDTSMRMNEGSAKWKELYELHKQGKN